MHRTWVGGVFLVVVAAVVTFPLWYSRAEPRAPEPIVHPSSGGECIEPVETMRRNHMTMLYDWRDSVVRTTAKDRRWYVNSKGEKFEKSLTRTCLGCHESRHTFCDRCHDRVSVTVTCFQCHASNRVGLDAGALPEAPHGRE